ncbi:MAG: DUF3630 family protein [Pseudomonadota bacterium]|uniref:DUF3630 family protein n=1 Tax=Gallaecimonas pentaromativorans TaxID=584787 RepID=UPI00067E96ED|nr:DUF3630 family protein [Gallaecimonas pentaromativorans]MED5525293.1 DUF3630 family protein [Pseudomonadota bacterium]
MALDSRNGTLILPVNTAWEHFEADIAPWLARLELSVRRKESGADRHQWWVEFEGTELRLEYEDLAATTWLEAEDEEGLEVLTFLAGWAGLK